MKAYSPSNYVSYPFLRVVYSSKQASCEWVWARGFCVRKSIFLAMMMASTVDNKRFIIFEAWGALNVGLCWGEGTFGCLIVGDYEGGILRPQF